MNGAGAVRHDVTFFSDHDIYLFREGSHYRLYDKMGSHFLEREGERGTYFAVWAHNARDMSVLGDFNDWNSASHFLKAREDGSGIWEGFIPGVGIGALYKYHLRSRHNGYEADKGDPFARYWECPPRTASVVWDSGYGWNDARWMQTRHAKNNLESPFSIYEVHFGSWRRVPEEGNRFLTYREAAPYLIDHVKHLGFTHVQFLPLSSIPFTDRGGTRPWATSPRPADTARPRT